MRVAIPRWLILPAAGVLALPVVGVWLAPAAPKDPEPGGLGPGRFLVARRELPDPNFENAVILLIQYGPKGAMGLVVNHRTDIPLSRVLKDVPHAKGREDRLFIGGPVHRGALLALQRSREEFESGGHVLGEIHLLTDRALLEKALAAGTGADRLRVYAGYSGWAPGQLDRELLSDTWHVMPGSADTVFDPKPEDVWQRLIRRTELRFALLGAPGAEKRSGKLRDN